MQILIQNKQFKNTVVLPLYASLPHEKQQLVFEEFSGIRKIVLATNIAEASVTIDGIVFVIDCGFQKQKFFDPKLNLEQLRVVQISK